MGVGRLFFRVTYVQARFVGCIRVLGGEKGYPKLVIATNAIADLFDVRTSTGSQSFLVTLELERPRRVSLYGIVCVPVIVVIIYIPIRVITPVRCPGV